MARKVLLVLAHPDDESMGNGTFILRQAASGAAVHLVCATRGGAGWNGRPEGAAPEDLPGIRSRELERAAAVLGLASVELWDYPDGGVPGCDQEEITRRIRQAVERLDPDLVVGWGPDGAYGHPDHIAVGACTDAALAGSGRPHLRIAVDQAEAAAMAAFLARTGADPGAIRLVAQPRVDEVFEPGAGELETVRRAIECHDSQLNEFTRAVLADPEILYWMARNCYVKRA